MAAGTSIEILDLRHFAASMLKPVLEAEEKLWRERLHWDYRASANLLLQYLDNHMLPGYVALDGEQPIGYAFSVYEGEKALIGEVFALETTLHAGGSAYAVEETLLKHLLELLTNSPQVERIESQLLLHPSGTHAEIFRASGFEVYRRLFMVQTPHDFWAMPRVNLPRNLELRDWNDEDLPQAARLICDAYQKRPDSLINDQYRTVHGSMRFLNNIVHYAGCGTFSAAASHVIIDRSRREMVALVLGSRVSPRCGHITQLCVHPSYRREGLARALLSMAAFRFLRQGVAEISLTVTEANSQAIKLYDEEGYTCEHMFDASVWERKKAE